MLAWWHMAEQGCHHNHLRLGLLHHNYQLHTVELQR